MSNLSAWDVTAGNNNATPPDGAPENMLRSAVNNTMREMMAAVARWYQDNLGTLVSTNSVNAYAVTTNSSHAAKADIGFLTFRVNAANTGAVTLNVDGLGATTWQKRSGVAYASGDLIANQLVTVLYNPNTLKFETVAGGAGEFDSGFSTVTFDDAAPNGWSKDTTANLHDTALRLVSTTDPSAGGETAQSAFSTVHAITATDGYTLAIADMPAHDHGAGMFSAASHDHNMGIDKNGSNYQSQGGSGDPQNPGSDDTGSSGALNVSGTSGSTGGGGAHAHDIDLRVNHHDIMKIIKD